MEGNFYKRRGKRWLDILVSFLGLVFLWPVFLIVAVAIKFDSGDPVFFEQKRIGGGGKKFILYKFRTTVRDAEKLQKKYVKLNEAYKPLFKIRNDPRFTVVGTLLSHTGLDELPQLFNILIGNMSLVGPRPLPLEEERVLTSSFRNARKKVLPRTTSLWVVDGAHMLSFVEWKKRD